MSEHRWTIPCQLDPETAEHELAEPLAPFQAEGWDVIEHVETVGFFGWTLREPNGDAVGVSIPQPGGPDRVLVRSQNEALGKRVVDALTGEGPLEGADVKQVRDG